MVNLSDPKTNTADWRTKSGIFSRNLMRASAIALGIATGGTAVSTATAAKYASVVIDAESGKILEAQNADARRYPASLTKIMTLYMVFDALENKKITPKTRMRVSRRASGAAPSKLGLRAGDTITVENAILALVTKSANDVATVVAEHLGGTEIGFARKMNTMARKIGMKRTTFQNASGLPNRQQMSTARDMAVLGMRIRKDFPQYYSYFGKTKFTYKGRTYGNHNKLLKSLPGTDGIKTGYIRDSGFNLVASTVQDGHRLIGVVFGGRTGKSRDAHMKDILNRGFTKVDALYVRAPNREQALAMIETRKRMAQSRQELQITVAKAQQIENMIDTGQIVAGATPQIAQQTPEQLASTMGLKSLRSPLLANASTANGMVRLVPLHSDASLSDVQRVAGLTPDTSAVVIAKPPVQLASVDGKITPYIQPNMDSGEKLPFATTSVKQPTGTPPVTAIKTPEAVATVNFIDRNTAGADAPTPSTPTPKISVSKNTVEQAVSKTPTAKPTVQTATVQSMPTPKQPKSDSVQLVLADAYITDDAVIDVGYDTRMDKLANALKSLQDRETVQVASNTKLPDSYKSPPKKQSKTYSVGSNNGALHSKKQGGLRKPSAPPRVTATPKSPQKPKVLKSRVQVGAYSSMGQARTAIKTLKQGLGDYAKLFDITIDPTAQGNNRTIFRLRLDNVPDKMLSQICENVQAKGFGCFKVGRSRY